MRSDEAGVCTWGAAGVIAGVTAGVGSGDAAEVMQGCWHQTKLVLQESMRPRGFVCSGCLPTPKSCKKRM